MAVHADRDALGGATGFHGLAIDEASLNLERFARLVQRKLRGDEVSFELWGLAIDQTLAAEEQGTTAGTFIVLTVIAALTVVGASLRAYWPTALTAIGVGALMIWLKGISALVGIKGGIVIELIVPIAMVSLGVDFAVHATRRYQEERSKGLLPPEALRIGMAGVLGALLLAMLSDGIAFLSNVSSGIEAIVHFGFAAGIAVFSSFIVLGIILPVALMRVDVLRSSSGIRHGWPMWVQLLGGGGVTALTGTGVILLVAVNQMLGASIIFLSAFIFVAVPLAILSLKRSRGNRLANCCCRDNGSSFPSGAIGRVVRCEGFLLGRLYPRGRTRQTGHSRRKPHRRRSYCRHQRRFSISEGPKSDCFICRQAC